MVFFDATMLIALLHPGIGVPRHPDTQQPVEKFQERINFLVSQLEQDRRKIIIPTPALIELLVKTGAAGPKYLAIISSSAVFRLAPFDVLCAVEVAAITKDAIDSGDKRDGLEGTWAKIKYDRQIVAIAKVNGSTVIYSDDGNIHTLGKTQGLTVVRVADLPLPPEEAQHSLDLPDGEVNAEQQDVDE